MSFLYRHALTVARKQPYVDWLNALDDEPPTQAEPEHAQRTIYLVPETDAEPDFDELVAEFWEEIFEEELAAGILSEDRWPNPRTREMFDAWFGVELTSSVYDLTPDEPLTQSEVDAAQLDEAESQCAWCGLELDEHQGRYAAFMLADRKRFAVFEGRVLPLAIDEERVVLSIVPPREDTRKGEDLLVRVCGDACAAAVRKAVPNALRELTRRTASAPEPQV